MPPKNNIKDYFGELNLVTCEMCFIHGKINLAHASLEKKIGKIFLCAEHLKKEVYEEDEILTTFAYPGNFNPQDLEKSAADKWNCRNKGIFEDYWEHRYEELSDEVTKLANFIRREFLDDMVKGSTVDNAINLLKMSKTGLLAAKAGKKLYNIEEIKNMIRNAFEEIVNDIDTNKKI